MISLASHAKIVATPRIVRAVARTLRQIAHDLSDGYRPERHYMRGPGPKWRAKHGGAGGQPSR